MSYNKDSDKQNKTELNVSTHQQKDKDKSGDYVMHGADADKDKNKHEKTSITFERKKVVDDKESHQNKDLNKDLSKEKDKKELHFESKDKDLSKDKDWNKDKDLNLNKDKDWNKDKDMHDKNEGESKGIIHTIKEKVKDVLGSGDNDKSKDKEKDVHMGSADYTKKDKDVHMGSADYAKKDKDVHMSSGGADYNKTGSVDYNKKEFGTAGVGIASGSSGQQYSSLGSSDISSSHQTSNLAASSGSDKQFQAAGAGYSGAGYSGATVDHKNLGAEHREAGYDKQSNVIPSKEKDKDSAHKVEVHGSLYTSGAGSTYKTNEAK